MFYVKESNYCFEIELNDSFLLSLTLKALENPEIDYSYSAPLS